jgi:hypothetical protein
MPRKPNKADKDFLDVVGSKLDTAKAKTQLGAGMPNPNKPVVSKKGIAKVYTRFAGANHGVDLALQKTAEMLGSEDKIREAQMRSAQSKEALRKSIDTYRSIGADSNPVARVLRRAVGLPASRLEAAAREGVVQGYRGTAGFIEDAGRAGSSDAVILGNLRPEQFEETVKKQRDRFKLAEEQAIGPDGKRKR